MIDFMDTLGALLGGQSAPQNPLPPIFSGPSPGAPSVSAPPAPPTPQGNVLARLRPPDNSQPSDGSYTNPLGLTPGFGGNNLGIALGGGLSAVRPGAGRFSAFAQGLGGALSARSNADIENRKLGLQQLLGNLEAQKTGLAIQQAQNQQNALNKVGLIGTGNGAGGAYPSYYNGPGASGDGGPSGAPPSSPSGAPAPMSPQPPPGDAASGPTPAPALLPAASSVPPTGTPPGAPSGQGNPGAPPVEAPPITVPAALANTTNFWMRVDPESNPYFLRQRASIMDQRAMIPGLPADTANNFARQAQQDRTSAESITNSNTVMMRSGQKMLIPGSIDTETTMAAAKARAEH